mgnify:CR=1 FL=1
MRYADKRPWLAATSVLTTQFVHAAPIEGEVGSNAAALLVVLGVWALFMGMRNLRELRHKRPTLGRTSTAGNTQALENPGPKAHN